MRNTQDVSEERCPLQKLPSSRTCYTLIQLTLYFGEGLMLKEKVARVLPALLATLVLTSSLITSARASVAFTPSTQYSGGHSTPNMRCPDACAGWIAAGAGVVMAGAAVVQAAAATAAAAAAESIVIIIILADPHRGHSLTPAQRTGMAAALDR